MMRQLTFILLSIATLCAETVYRVPIEGTIDLGLPPYIKRMLNEAESNNASAVIFDINTFGGRVDAA